MITVFGATGYTGVRVAGALSRLGLPFRLAGRSREKLASLSASLPGSPQWVVADALAPDTLPALMRGTRLLINCAGPFTDLGERVVVQAAINGVHYLDMTNELGYRYKLQGYDELARGKQSAVVPACGFEVALADCAAALLGKRLAGAMDELQVVYQLSGSGASVGTLQSGVRSLGTSWIAYRGGVWKGLLPAGRVRRFDLPPQKDMAGQKPIWAVEFPSCEAVTAPASLAVRNISVWMNIHPSARLWAPVLIPLVARLARSKHLGPRMARLAGGRGARPGDESGQNTFTVYVEATQGAAKSWMTLRGEDVYGLTAEIAGYAAGVMLAPGYSRSGVLAPAQAFDPQAFIHWLRNSQGVSVAEGQGNP